MKSFIKVLVFLIPFWGFSQKAAPNTFTVSKAGMAKYETMTDIIPNFPTYKKVIHFEIAAKANDKPIVMSGSNNFSIESFKQIVRGADLKSKVFLDLKLQQHDSKISASSYKFYIVE